MKPPIPLLALLLMPHAAFAAPTDIAQSPLLNIAGSGVVRPNLMVLYDNSGSMERNFTPDYIDDSICRNSSTLAAATPRGCKAGDPPFNAAQFNKQYYNPQTLYQPPAKADGTPYPAMNSAATTGWTAVTNDGYNKNKKNFRDTVTSTSDLVTGFPDYKWCLSSSSSDCFLNAATYSYPDATYRTPVQIVGNPFYYNINVGEHCSDAELKNCIDTPVGAPAPASHPFPARVRFCTTRALTTCQAKYLDTHKYPRFSNPAGGKISFGALAISHINGDAKRIMTALTVNGENVLNGEVEASTGLNSPAEINAFITLLAQSVINKVGLPSQFTACVRTPTIATVPACSAFGLTIATGQVAIIPVNCRAGNTTKEIGDACDLVLDNSRANQPVAGTSTTITATGTNIASGNAIFTRVDIIPSRDSYPRSSARLDCASTTACTYVEEMTNFANWYAYYRTRNQLLKSAVGLAFAPVGAKYNVGLVALSTAAAGGTMNTPKQFTGADRTLWYQQLYAMDGTGYTPTRAGLHSIGKMYANLAPYAKAAGSEVVQYPCQQNFTFVTSDGYWNNAGPGPEVTNNDNVENADRFCTKDKGCVQDNSDGVSLADVALYWYNGGSSTGTSSLRPTLEDYDNPGLVPAKTGENARLHMKTFTLGLGIDGLMAYDRNYTTKTNASSDFGKVLTREPTGCPWNDNKEWVWPDPKTSVVDTDPQSRVDDLWHAAVNGRGQYFSAAEPAEVVDSLTLALLNIESKVGAAAAAATSTPNISLQDNDIFSDTFTTVKWYGELTKRKIDTLTGDVIPTKLWNSSDRVGLKVDPGTDTRKILMLDVSTGLLKNFKFAEMSAAETGWFANKCSLLFQCSDMTTDERALANSGDNLVNWLRGQQQYANNTIFREYSKTDGTQGVSTGVPIVLGDIASSKPAFMRQPRKGYKFDGYPAFVAANKTRAATVFVGANDGMMHAFNAVTGDELWAYAPRITMKKLFKQASTTYGSNHQYTVDGSPEVSDVFIGGVWKSILVSGLNGGGRGYFALDVTDPLNPKAMWELCADPTVCSGVNLEPEIGLTFGNAQFGKWNNKWVVFLSSGYNNIPGSDGVPGGSGNGFLFIIDVATGAVLKKTPTMAGVSPGGTVGTPSGLAKITGINSNPNIDPVLTHIYGGDNLGQMWRFDLETTPGSVKVTRMGNSGPGQPITSRPEVTSCKVSKIVDGVTLEGVERIVVYGTGRLLDVPDLSSTGLQSIYAIKDSALEVTPWRTGMIQQSLVDFGVPGNYTVTNNVVDLGTATGWYVNLDKNARERINLDPKIVFGSVSFVSNIPAASTTCTVGGKSKIYTLDVCTGSYLNNTKIVGKTISEDAAVVGSIMVQLETGAVKLIITKANGATDTEEPSVSKSHDARKAGWRRVNN